VKPSEPARAFSASTTASAGVTSLLTVYCGGAFALSLMRHLDWTAVSFTGLGMVMFAAMTALKLRLLHEERRAQSEYSLTASRHSSKPVRSP